MDEKKVNEHVDYVLKNFSMAEADMIASRVLEFINHWLAQEELNQEYYEQAMIEEQSND